MADDNTENPTATETPAAAAEQPAATAAITPEIQAAIEAAAKKARDSAFAEARRLFEGKSKAETPKAKQEQPAPSSAEPARDVVFEDALNDALAEQKSLTKDQRQLVRKLARSERPENVDEYVASLVRTFGVAQASTPNPTAPKPAAATIPTASPVTTPAPSTAVPTENPDDVMQWDEQQWARHIAKHGGRPDNPMHWANRKAAIEIAKRYAAAMSRRRVVQR